MMKHSILTQLKRKTSTKTNKTKKKVHWCKQLEVIHVFTPDSENNVQDELTFSSSEFSSSDPLELPRESQTMKTTGHVASEIQHKLQKLSIESEPTRFTVNNRLVWKKVAGAENSFIGEDWV